MDALNSELERHLFVCTKDSSRLTHSRTTVKIRNLILLSLFFLIISNFSFSQVATLQSAGATTICSGESTAIEVVITASVGPYTVVYSDGSTNFTEAGYNSDENSSDDITVSPTSTTTYSLVSVRDTYGTLLLPISTATVTITVNPIPTNIVVTLDPEAPICPDVNFEISATATDGDSYEVWNAAGTTKLGDAPYTTSISTTTNYLLKAITTEACSATHAFSAMIDNIKPDITCPSDQNLNMGAGTCNATLPDYTGLVTKSDNCTAEGDIALTQSPISGTTLSGGHNSTQVVTVTATDESGNFRACSFTVTVKDTEAPVLSGCPSNIVQDTDEGEAGAIVTWVEPSASDNCTASGSLTWTNSHSPGDFFNVGATTVTYTATDAAGNVSDVCSFTVTISDNEDPEITCPGNISVNNDASECGAVVTYVAPVGTDNFPGAVTTQIAGLASGSLFPVGTTTNTFRVTDAYGNTADCSFTVTVTDTEDPQISCIADISTSVDAGACTAVVNYSAPVGTDNCAGAVTTQTAGLASGSEFPVGTTTNTFLVTDAVGRTATCSFDVTVVDDIDPEITCPANISQTADADDCGAVITYIAPVGTDNCAGAVTTQTAGLASGSEFPVGVTTNTFRVTDASGNYVECSFTVTITDDQNPVVVDCPSNISQSNDNGNCSAVVTWIEPSATDNCTSSGNITWTKSHSPGSVFNLGTTTVTYQAEDEAGNLSAVCSFDITVVDDENPQILNCPANITRSNTLNQCDAVVTWTEPTATDNCTSSGNITWTKSHLPGATFPVGVTTVTYEAEDEAGNTASCSFNVTVADNQKPVISGCPSNISQSSDGGACTAVVTWVEPTAADNCTSSGNLVWTKSHNSGDVFSAGTTTVTYSVQDEAGNNSLTCSFDVTIADAVDPVAVCQDITVYLDDEGKAVITANDVDNGSSDNCNLSSLNISKTNFNCGDIGDNTVVLTAVDAMANTATCNATVTIVDNTDPVLTPKAVPANKYVTSGFCYYTIQGAEFDPDYSDNCSVTILTYSIDGGATVGTDETTSLDGVNLSEGSHDFEWLAYDASGNVSTAWTFSVNVVDNQAPVLGAISNKFRNTNSACTYVVSGTEFDVSVTDNCGAGGVTLSYTMNGGSSVVATSLAGVVLGTGNNAIVWTATDGTNTSTRSFVVNVTDAEAPSIQQISDITVNSGANCEATATWSLPTVSDNCTSSPTLTRIVGPASGSTFSLGTTLIKYKAVDAQGNISYMEFNVIVENNDPPQITCPSGSPFARTAPEGSCYYTVSGTEFNPTSFSGCEAEITNSYDGTSSLSGKQILGGTHTIVWTVTDEASATSTCSIVVDVESDQDMSFTVPVGHFDRNVDGGECYYTIPGNVFDATDLPTACAGSTVSVSGTLTQGASTIASGFTTLSGYQLPKGENYSVVWTLSDGGSLSISSTPFTISVFDNQEPTFVCYGNTTLDTDAGFNYYEIQGTEFDAYNIIDNCDASFDVSFTVNGAAGVGTSLASEQLLTGVHTVIWTVEDQSGNDNTCSFNITVEDNEAPSITSIANATRYIDDGTCFYAASGGEFNPSYSDNVGVTSMTNLVNNSSTLDAYEFPVGVTTVIWKAIDAAGNVTQMSFTVTVIDDEAPDYTLPATATRYVNSACYYRVVGTEFNPSGISDNCCSSNYTITNDENSYHSLAYHDFSVGTHTVNWTVTDNHGNSSVKQIVITVLDNSAPVFSCPAYTLVRISDSGHDYYTVSGSDLRPSYWDNCGVSSIVNDYNGLSTLNGVQLPEGEHTIVWTATDADGNSSQCSVDVVVTNSLYPQITCLSNQSRGTDAGECYYTISGDEFAPTVAYGAPTITYSLNSAAYVSSLDATVLNAGTHYIRVKASWVIGGNTYTSYCGFYVIVYDDEDPVITPLSDITVNANTSCWAHVTNLGTLVATDNCTSSGNLIINDGLEDDDYYFYVGDTEVTWTVTDEAGNDATYVQTITVVDASAPSISCNSSVTVEANDPSGTFYIGTQNEFNPTMWEHCSNPTTYTHDYASASSNTTLAGESFPTGTTTITWTATDSEGNTNTCTFNITVVATSNPHISCNGPKWRTADSGVCYYTVSGTEFDVSSTTSGTTLTHNIVGAPLTNSLAGAVLPVGTNTIVWTATNGAYSSVCTFNVYVSDNEDPIVVCPADVTVSVDAGSCSTLRANVTLPVPTASDNCTGVSEINYSNNAPTVFEKGTTVVRWAITDDHGNLQYCYQDVTVVDDIDPEIDCPATEYYREFDNLYVSYYTVDGYEFTPDADDNCELVSYINSENSSYYLNGEELSIGTNTITWTATDESSNTTTCDVIVHVFESFEPQIECVDDASRNTATGDCVYTVVGDELDAENVSIEEHPTFALTHDYAGAPLNTTLDGAEFDQGTYTITWTGTQTINGTLYTSTCSFELTIEDNQSPVITTAPSALNFNVDAGLCTKYYELPTISATDNCPGLAITNNAPDGYLFPRGTTIVRWYVTDVDGNVVTADQTVTVTDNEAPVISDCPADPTAVLASASACKANVSWTAPTATDACSGLASFTSNHQPGALFSIGTTTVTYTATDFAGNVSTCSFDVTVIDEDPEITCVSNQTRTTDPGECSYQVMGNEFDPTAFSDNCAVQSVSYSFFDGSNTITGTNSLSGIVIPKGAYPGQTTITWTITDNNARTETCSFVLTVQDDEPPVIKVPGDQIRSTDSGENYYTTIGDEFDIIEFDDNCGIVTYYVNGSEVPGGTLEGEQYAVGEHTISWMVEDEEGNQTTAAFTLIVEDNEAPTLLTAETGTNVPNDNGDCGAIVNYIEPVFEDNVTITENLTITVVTDLQETGDYFDLGTTSVLYIVEDENGNIYNYYFDVTVYDDEDPTITCPAGSPFSRETDDGFDTYTAILTEFDPTAYGDNCSATIINDYNGLSSLAGAEFPMGTTTVIWTVTDENSNSVTCSINVVVDDIIEPEISSCPDATISADADAGYCYFTVNTSEYDPTGFSDNDVLDRLTYSLNGGAEVGTDLTTSLVGLQIPVGTTSNPTSTVVWKLYDASDNWISCSSVFTISDTQDPVVVCPGNKTRSTDANQVYYTVIGADNLDPTISDNCDVELLTYSVNGGAAVGTDENTSIVGYQLPIGTNTIVWELTDIHGNSSNCSFTVTVADNEAPTVTCNNITVELASNGSYTLDAADISDIGAGSYDASGIDEMTVTPSTFSCVNVGANTVTLYVTDIYDNLATCTANVTVQDNIDPVAICKNVTVQLDAFGQAVITASQINNASTDNCGIASISASQTSFDCTDVGVNEVTLTVTDVNGNSATCTANVTVQDIYEPVAVCQNIVRYLDATGNISIAGVEISNGSYDNCSSNLIYSASQTDFDCSDVGTNSVVLTVTDAGGNSDVCNATVSILDNLDPIVVCQDITINLDVDGNATITVDDIDNGSSDNCGIATRTLSKSSFTCSDVGENTVTLIVTDDNGNSETCTATVTVVDIPATATCQDITIQLDSDGNATIAAADIDNGSSDACGAVSLSIDKSSFDCTNVGSNPATNTVTLTVTDVNSNTSTCTALVTVQDVTNPTVVCQNLTVNLDATGNVSITPAQVDNGSSDACGIQSLALDKTAFDCDDLGDNTVTLTVTDVNGNSATCNATITVNDIIDPVAVGQDITVNLNASGTVTITGLNIDNGSSDNCSIASYVANPATFDCGDVGANTVTLTVTDPAGNTDQTTVTVTVEDNVNPTAVCKNITLNLDVTGNASITASSINNNSSDACGIQTMTASKTAFTCSDLGPNSVTLTVTDVNGNSSQCTSTVTVVDVTDPVITCTVSGTQNVTTDSDVCTYTHPDNSWNPSATDECTTIASLTYTLSGATTSVTAPNTTLNGQVFNKGTTVVTWTAFDGSGNSSTCSFSVSLTDDQNPNAICQNATVYVDINGDVTVNPSDINNASNDNCTVITLLISKASSATAWLPSLDYDCSELGSTGINLQVRDDAGNISTCSSTLTVLDNIAPTHADLSDRIVTTNNNVCTYTHGADTWNVYDNCDSNPTKTYTLSGATTVVTSPNTSLNGQVFEQGTTTVTWTAQDASGNSTTTEFDVIVNDEQDPTITCPADLEYNVLSVGATNRLVESIADPVYDDNCSVTNVTWVMTGATIASNSNSGFNHVNSYTFNVGTTTLTYTAYDAAGNTETCSFDVVINALDGAIAASETDLITSEPNITDNFTVTLGSAPTGTVVIDVTSSDLTEATVSPATLTFNASNWSTPQTVTVTGVNDDVDDDDQNYTVTLSINTTGTQLSSGYYYASSTILNAVNHDDDDAGYIVSTISGNTSENLTAHTFTVRLETEPVADVEISLSSSDLTEGDVTSSATLTFTSANWNTNQTVTVTGIDDFIVDGDVTYYINLSNASSTDPKYDGLFAESVTVINEDNDAAGFTVTPSSGLETTEGGSTATFTVVLNSKPATDLTDYQVVIDVSSSDLTEGTVSPASLTFTAANWNVEQTVTVTGVDDIIVDGDIPYTVVLALNAGSTTDPVYVAPLDPQDVSVTNLDDDQAVVSINSVSVLEGNSGTTPLTFTLTHTGEEVPAGYSVSYYSQNVNATTPSDYTPVGGSVSFTGSIGETKTITVNINGDEMVEPNETFRLVLSFVNAPGLDVIRDAANYIGTGTITNDDNATFAINDVSIIEGNTGTQTLTFTVTLSQDVECYNPITFDYTTVDGSATTADGDYVAKSGSLSFSGTAGETKTTGITINGDTKVEMTEYFDVELSNIQCVGLPAPILSQITFADDSGRGTITNDDAAAISITDVTANETHSGTTDFDFTITMSYPSDAVVTVDYATNDATALLADNDYNQLSTTTLSFAAGETSKVLSVQVVGDETVELNETFELNLSNLVNNGRNISVTDAQGIGTIVNDDSANITINDVSITEGDAGTSTLTFTVTHNGNSLDVPFSVDYTSSNGTASVADGDYDAVSGTLNFSGTTAETQTIEVTINGDTKVELDESFAITLSNLQASSHNISIADATGIGTITNDDSAVITIDDITHNEGDAGTVEYEFTITMSDVSDANVVLNYASANATATTADSDYSAVSGTHTFTPGQTTKTVSVLVNGDTKVELDETFTVNLSGLSTNGRDITITDNSGLGTIVNDDAIELNISSVSQNETNSGQTVFTFDVTMSTTSDANVVVDYATANGTALVADSDYDASTGSLTFTPGQTALTFDVLVNGDTKVEMDETFTATITENDFNGRDVSINTGTGTGTILNDDSAVVTITDVTANETHSGTTDFDFTITMSYPSDAVVTVDYATADATALLSDNDYNQLTTTTLSFAAGETSKVVTVEVVGDETVELDETFELNLTNLVNNGRNISVTDAQGIGTIVNDDSANITINDVSITEGDAGTSTLTFTVTHNGNSLDVPFTVDYASSDFTAIDADGDYDAVSGTLNFSGTTGQTKTIAVTINGDAKVELDETFNITLSNLQASAHNISIADATGVGTITNDDSAVITIDDVEFDEGDAGTVEYVFTITMSDVSDANVVLDYASVEGTATIADNDYTAVSGTHTFTPGQTSKTVSVFVNGDTQVEPDEAYTILLSALNNNGRDITITDNTGLGTITNDDSADVNVTSISQVETHSGQTGFVFTVSLTDPSAATTTVDFATSDVTATVADGDYDANSGTLTFNPGVVEQSFTVLVNGDTKVELDETFTVTLTNLFQNGLEVYMGTPTGTGTIENDDSAVITVADVTLNEGNSGTTDFDFVITMSYPSDAAVSVDYATADVSAIDASDYTAISNSVTFAAGETSKTITVSVLTDLIAEPDETFTFTLSNLVNNGRVISITDDQAIGTIWNDDAPTANAGIDASICQNGTYSLADATVHNNDGLLWETSGDGTFTSTSIVNPIYTPGTADIAAGTVTLTLTAYGMGVNISNAVDQMELTVEWVRWTGVEDTDWHNTNNWCATIPTYIDQVFIPASAPHQPIIENGDAAVGEIVLEVGASLGFTNDRTLSVYREFINNGTINAGSGDETIVFMGATTQFTSGGSVLNNISVNSAANLTVNDDLNIAGDIDIDGGFNPNALTVSLVGTTSQTVNSGSSAFNNLIVNNTSALNNAIQLSGDVAIGGNLTLTQGIINTGSFTVIMNDGSSSNEGSVNAFVDGNISKIGSTAYVFPTGEVRLRDIGDGEQTYVIHAPFGMTPAESTTVSVNYNYTSDGMPQWWYHVWTHQFPLNHTSDREHWIVSSNADLNNVTLYWRNNDIATGTACPHSFCDDNLILDAMTIAYWDGIWKDANASAATATASDVYDSGSMTAIGTIPFDGAKGQTFISFASKDKDATLPVELIKFEAECNNPEVVLQWSCASEDNNDFFTIERSSDNKNFKEIAVVDAEGFSSTRTDYSYVDEKSVNETWYYRLSQTDIDGKQTQIGLISVDCYELSADITTVEVYPNPFKDGVEVMINSDAEGKLIFEILDDRGRTIMIEENYKSSDQNVFRLNADNLKPAMYYLRVKFNNDIYNFKLIRQ
ncbi:MAG: HYR domain-containing protein [Bacteroidales bacterium]|nr:HYR domain-containing protein [Bacteroidales bacterium]